MTQESIEARNQGNFPMDDPTKGLEQDHKYIRQLMQRFLSTRDPQVKQQAGPRICEALELHTSLEEAVFYPHVRALDDALIDRCLNDHQEADRIIRQLQNLQPGQAEYDDLMQQLHDCVTEHMDIEENQLFPAVRESELDLNDLALQMQGYESNLVASQARQSAPRPEQRH
jgi:hemerythrin superfamily protein